MFSNRRTVGSIGNESARGLLCISLLAAAATAQSVPEFALVRRTFATNLSLSGATLADWDRDGFADLLLGHATQVSWMRGHGDGDFDPLVPIPGGAGSSTLVWDDFDGDGRLDAVDENFGPGNVRVAYQTPAGTLGPPVLLAPNAMVRRVKDFDGDGRLDLFISSTVGVQSSVRFLLNTPTGWQATVPVSIGMGRTARIADFDGNGLPDLAYWEINSKLVLRLGTSLGAFGPDISPVIGSVDSPLEVADFNGDGKEEAVFAGPSTLVVVRVASAANVLTKQVQGATWLFGTPADFDSDGDVDLLASTRVGPQILRNDGTGRFDDRRVVALDPYLLHLSVPIRSGDANGDGAAEFVTAAGDYVAFSLSDGQGAWSQMLPTPIPRTHALKAMGDVDGDGLADFGSRRLGSAEWIVSRSIGNGLSRPLARIPFPSMTDSLEFLDVDGDGDLDAFGRSDWTLEIAVSLNDGTGRFGRPVVTPGYGAPSTNVGDFNGDGKLDLLESFPNLELLPGTGTGGFGAPISIANGYVPIAGIGDFDADGRDDALEVGASYLRVRRGTANGGFASPLVTTIPGSSPAKVALGDFNGDGRLDAAWLESAAPLRLARAFGDGAGRFSLPVMTALSGPVSTLTLERVDLGPDGLDDLALADFRGTPPGDRLIRRFESSSAGTLTELERVPSSDANGRNFVIDVTGDGVAELVLLAHDGDLGGVTLRRR